MSKAQSGLEKDLPQYSDYLSSSVAFQGCREHLKLGGTTLRGHFFLKKKGAFSKNETDTSLFIAKSWETRAPNAPGSYV